jgi:hypothetical protein
VTKRLNGFQRLLQAFAVSKPGAALLARTIHRVDPFLLRVSGGRWSVPALSGIPALLLTTTGARSGQRQVVPLVGVPDGERLILVASSFGRSRTPAWSYNLRAHPECQVRLGT